MSAAELAEFRAWLQSNPAHEAAFEEAQRLWCDVEQFRQEFTPFNWADETVRVLTPDNLGRTQSSTFFQHRTAPRKRCSPFVVAGGMVATVIFVSVALFGDFQTFFFADYRTGLGERSSFTLPDGSVAHLNTDSAMAIDYSSTFRLVHLLRGEALFEVAPNPSAPFRVIARNGMTEAVGTVFVVRTLEHAVMVTVTTGAVNVTIPEEREPVPAEAAMRMVRIERGQQVAYGRTGELGLPRAVDAAVTTAWRDGKIIFEGKPFAEALAEFDRYLSGWIFVFADVSSTRPVSGVFTIDRLNDGVAALAATQGLTATRLSRYLTIVR